ncbi:MAG: iron-sulfur cluster assembly scaffold protein [Novosphingobium sp.]
MSSTAALYTPEVLGLATGLARYPLNDGLPLRGSSRAPVCGSTIELGLASDAEGRITQIGLKAHACAIGQAAAALFAEAAPGRTRAELAESLTSLERWLAGPDAPLPDWPGLTAIAAARSYPARHGAILLPWKAALAALP